MCLSRYIHLMLYDIQSDERNEITVFVRSLNASSCLYSFCNYPICFMLEIIMIPLQPVCSDYNVAEVL